MITCYDYPQKDDEFTSVIEIIGVWSKMKKRKKQIK